MEALIRFALSNFTLAFLVVGLIASAVALMRGAQAAHGAGRGRGAARLSPAVLDRLRLSLQLRDAHLLLRDGGALHRVGGQPVPGRGGFASLGFAVVGLLAFRRSFDLRLAAVVGPALFLLGAAGGHLYQMVTAGNFAPSNAGVILYTDILIPITGFVLLWLQHRYERASAVPAPVRP
jgi:hypothetical protein